MEQSIYIEQIINQMVRYSQLDFENKLDIITNGEIDEQIPALAIGVNILGEELQHKVLELNRMNNEMEKKNDFINSITKAIPEIIFVYDNNNKNITYLNKCINDDPYFPCPLIVAEIANIGGVSEIKKTMLPSNTEVVIEKTKDNEIKINRANQKTRWYRTTINDFEKGDNGEAISTIQTLSDITILKEKELQLILNENTISNSLKEKELLLQEVHHRVKNNLQIISGLLDMQINRLDSDEIKCHLQSIKSRIHSISLIHEELYQADHLDRINVSQYCKRVCANLSEIFYTNAKNIKLIYNISSEIYFPLEKSIPLGLLINEIISNCFKHAFKTQEFGTIWINFNKENESFVLEIKDSGKGIGQKNLQENSKKSLGNKLIKGLALQLGCTLETKTTDGYSVKLKIPKLEKLNL